MLAELAIIAATCAPDIHITTLSAVVKHESRGNPYAIGINKGASLKKQPKSQEEAIDIVNDLIDRGVDFDAGLGQINFRNWEWLKLTPETVFDPCINLGAAQSVLRDCYERASLRFQEGQPALHAALSCYNTGNFQNGIKNGYVDKVAAAAGLKVPALTSPSAKSPAQQRAPTKAPLRNSDKNSSPKSTPDAFHSPRGDAFSQPRLDAFSSQYPSRIGVGTIRQLR